MLEIELIRHVKVAGASALYGHTDVAPLASDNARLLNCLLNKQSTEKAYDSIICSPLLRCKALAVEFSNACQLPLVILNDFKEMNFGQYDGVSFDEISNELNANKPNVSDMKKMSDLDNIAKLNWSTLNDFFDSPAINTLPEGECLADFHQRVICAWKGLIEKELSNAVEKKATNSLPRRVLVIVHGGVIRLILAHILQVDWEKSSWYQHLQIGNASLSKISVSRPYQEANASYQKSHQQVLTIAMPFIEPL